MNAPVLTEYFEAHREAMVEELAMLVQYESPSSSKPLLDLLAFYLQERFRAVGAIVSLISNSERGAHLQVVYSPDHPLLPDSRTTLLLGHLDTVWPAGTLARRPFRVEGNRAWGPGVFDMKASIVLVEFALRALRDLQGTLPRPVILLLNSDEEQGSQTSRALIEEHARRAEHVLVLEPPLANGILKTARKGVGEYLVEIQGKAAHSGIEPEKGISAIQEMAHQILSLHQLNSPEQGTTVNVGLANGGTQPNVVAAQAELRVDVRAWTTAEAERIDRAITAMEPVTPGARIRIEGGFDRPPMERTPAVAALFRRAQEVASSLGMELREGSTGGASDGNLTAAMGVPTLDGLGVPGDGAHAEHEHILVDSLPSRAALLTALLQEL